ncbi:MAG: BamA/TamA family outer membrane protein [Saprospiraceae bacterium]
MHLLPSNQEQIFSKKLRTTYQLTDSTVIQPTLNKLIDSLQQAAFLTASIDSLIQKNTSYTTYLFLGKKYDDFQISQGNIDALTAKRIGLARLLSQPITYAQLKKIQEKLLIDAENNGYPFATIRLEKISIEGTKVKGQLFWSKGRLIRLAALKTEGEGALNTTYLENYLGLKKGTIYQKDKIRATSQKLQELPFIKEARSPAVRFKGEEATVNLFLAPKKANRFDFLIGVLPNNQESGKVLVTADIDAEFQNQFGKGERVHFEFEQLRPETQRIILETSYPYLLNTPLGVDFEFGLYKKDSTYRDLIWNIGLQYLFEGGNYIKAFSKNTASTLLTIDEGAVIRNRQLPQNLDLRNSAFGLAYQLEKLDYLFNPRSGWLLHLEGSAGFKTIRKNNKITDLIAENDPVFDFESLYDGLDLMTFQYQIIGRIDKYFPISKRGALKTSIQGAAIITETPIFRNEQFRLGGNQLLRGFDEESIFATNYVLGTLEYRYLIGQNSYFFVFGDMAYLQNKTNENDFANRPIGVGAGMTFETKAGIFGISYALGKLEDTVFEFRAAKVHFGFVSLF